MSERGTLKQFNQSLGFGFIIPDKGGPDVMLHRSVLPAAGPPITQLVQGLPITYDVIETPRGYRAANVKWEGYHG